MDKNSDSLRVNIKPTIKSIIKFGFAFQGILIMIICIGGLIAGVAVLTSELPIFSLLIFAVTIFFIVIGKKYLDEVFYDEYILVNHKSLKLIHKTWCTEKEHTFTINEIQFLGFTGMHEFTRHPMEGDTVDFTGLGTGERELQFLIAEGTMEIRTEHNLIKFGKNITSWDADEITQQLENYLGDKLKNKQN